MQEPKLIFDGYEWLVYDRNGYIARYEKSGVAVVYLKQAAEAFLEAKRTHLAVLNVTERVTLAAFTAGWDAALLPDSGPLIPDEAHAKWRKGLGEK